MPITSEQRRALLLNLTTFSDKELREVRSHVNAEISRRISKLLVNLLPGARIRFAAETSKSGELIRWDAGTLVRIHRRSLELELLNGRSQTIAGERFIEEISDNEWAAIRARQQHGPAAEQAVNDLNTALMARVPELKLDDESLAPIRPDEIHVPD